MRLVLPLAALALLAACSSSEPEETGMINSASTTAIADASSETPAESVAH